MSELVQFYIAIYSFGALVIGLAVWQFVRGVRKGIKPSPGCGPEQTTAEPGNAQPSRMASSRKSADIYGWLVLGGWILFAGFCWLVQELDWFHDLRAWLNAPVPTWMYLVGVCTLYAGISELKKIISRNHEVLGDKLDLIQQQRRSLESIEHSMWNRR